MTFSPLMPSFACSRPRYSLFWSKSDNPAPSALGRLWPHRSHAFRLLYRHISLVGKQCRSCSGSDQECMSGRCRISDARHCWILTIFPRRVRAVSDRCVYRMCILRSLSCVLDLPFVQLGDTVACPCGPFPGNGESNAARRDWDVQGVSDGEPSRSVTNDTVEPTPRA